MTATMPTELSRATLRDWVSPAGQDDGKDERGTVLVIGGSERTAGAVLLAGTAALRAGAGRLQVGTIASAVPSFSAALPEALVQSLETTRSGAVEAVAASQVLKPMVAPADAILIGPGLEDPDGIEPLLAALLPEVRPKTTVVIDAQALRALPQVRSVLDRFSGDLVLTPNAGEARFLGASFGDLNPRAQRIAEVFRSCVTLEGEVAAQDGHRWRTRGRVPGLGTSGSGDVLAGIIAGIAARSGDPVQAACLGTYLHLRAGKELSKRVGTVGFLAREVADEVPSQMDRLMT
jgi:hydroxyethylthiazole kinase-like uncharacterized protein yjeF